MTNPHTQDLDPSALVAALTDEHRLLDEQVRELERKRALTPAEQQALARLKKRKLQARDRLARLVP